MLHLDEINNTINRFPNDNIPIKANLDVNNNPISIYNPEIDRRQRAAERWVQQKATEYLQAIQEAKHKREEEPFNTGRVDRPHRTGTAPSNQEIINRFNEKAQELRNKAKEEYIANKARQYQNLDKVISSVQKAEQDLGDQVKHNVDSLSKDTTEAYKDQEQTNKNQTQPYKLMGKTLWELIKSGPAIYSGYNNLKQLMGKPLSDTAMKYQNYSDIAGIALDGASVINDYWNNRMIDSGIDALQGSTGWGTSQYANKHLQNAEKNIKISKDRYKSLLKGKTGALAGLILNGYQLYESFNEYNKNGLIKQE